MPLYEYGCSCGARFEKLISFNAAADAVACPTCGAATARRLVSLVASFANAKDAGPTQLPMASRTGGCCGGGCACH